MLFTFVCTLFRSSHRRYFIESCPEKFCNIHMETPVLESLFNKAAALQVCSFIKKKLQRRCFPVIIGTFLRIHILKNICERLLLFIQKICWSIRIVSLKKCFQRVFEFIKKNIIYKKNFICKEKSGAVKKVRKLRSIISFIMEIWY